MKCSRMCLITASLRSPSDVVDSLEAITRDMQSVVHASVYLLNIHRSGWPKWVQPKLDQQTCPGSIVMFLLYVVPVCVCAMFSSV